MDKIRVELGKDSYDIHIGYGLWREMSSFIMGRGYSRKTMIVTDEVSHELNPDRSANFEHEPKVPHNELT